MARNMIDIKGVAIDINNILMLEKLERSKNGTITREYGIKITFKSRAFKIIWFDFLVSERDSVYKRLFSKLK
jgi:hypothetical protein